MSPYRRNILVGITVVGALAVLGWMILKFGDRPARLFATPSQPVTFITDRADGLGEGSNITYRGVIVGRVLSVARTQDGLQVLIRGQVDRSPPLPKNVDGVIRQLGQLGPSSNLNLELTGAQPQGQLEPGATLRAHYEGLSLFPPEVSQLATELRLTAQQFRQSQIVLHLDQQVEKAGTLIDSVNTLVSDPQLRENLKVALANIRQASETINKLGTKFDKLADQASDTMGDVRGAVGDVRTTVGKAGNNLDSIGKQVSDRLQQLSVTLDHFQSISAKIDNGKGTAGQLINDPKLYQALVDSSLQLNATIADLKRLVEQWEQEGLHFKLSK
jgi:phospholipid/cholesterol/gamma-HCH transport system substrate-binding protein